MGEAWIIDAVRTPRGRGKKDVGALVHTHPQELMATTLRALAARSGIDPHDVDDVVVGCVSQAGDQGACIARNAVLLAQWPQEVTGVSLNRFCGSGLQGVNFALMGVMSGLQQLVVGGGVESMSRQPIGSDDAGAVLIASPEYARAHGLQCLGTLTLRGTLSHVDLPPYRRLLKAAPAGVIPEAVLQCRLTDLAALEEIEGSMLAGMQRMTEEGRPSTAQDMLKGRRTEIDFLNGLVAAKGEEVGIPAPTHAALTEVVKRVERGEIEAHPRNVEKL